jgi:hypothetical protein
MSENDSKRNSRRNFLKTGAVAGGAAAVIGLSVGIPNLMNNQNTVKAETTTTQYQGQNCDNGAGITSFGNYVPKERWYFLYATDGISCFQLTNLEWHAGQSTCTGSLHP